MNDTLAAIIAEQDAILAIAKRERDYHEQQRVLFERSQPGLAQHHRASRGALDVLIDKLLARWGRPSDDVTVAAKSDPVRLDDEAHA